MYVNIKDGTLVWLIAWQKEDGQGLHLKWEQLPSTIHYQWKNGLFIFCLLFCECSASEPAGTVLEDTWLVTTRDVP